MTNRLTREQKIRLGEMIGAGHRQFGLVAPRRPYAKDDDDERGGSGAGLLLDHPLLMRQPLGASSDLTFLTNENNFSTEKAEERSDEINPELRKALENKLGHELAYKPPKAPEAKMY